MVNFFRRLPLLILTVVVTGALLFAWPDEGLATTRQTLQRSSKKPTAKISKKQTVVRSSKKQPAKKQGRLRAAKGWRRQVTARSTRSVKSRLVASSRVAEPVSDLTLRKQLSSRSAIVVDAGTGRTIYAHAPDRPGQPASTIKVLTGLISIRSLGQNDMVPVSRHAAGMPSSKVYLKEGQTYRANDLINAVLLSSANDASVALAEKIGGSEPAFANLMTDTAEKLGARNTVCKTATGLTAEGQQSTAHDLALLFNAAMQHPEFASRVARTTVQTSYGKTLKNHNKALWKVAGTEGGKTGYTCAARQTYVGKFRRSEGELLVAVMGSETMWSDVARLVEYGFRAKKQEQAALIQVTPTATANTLAKVRCDLAAQYGGAFQVLDDSRKDSRL